MFDTLITKVSDAMRFLSGKATIIEKNIDDAVDTIKIAFLETDVNLKDCL
ncbi:MAG: signal recognition particle receptor subunit alpha [Treponema sp.]|jgi:signal recognition particle subunit SRP54|nr:signal recognition particle receptor subunit alpha [Treponema sp.]